MISKVPITKSLFLLCLVLIVFGEAHKMSLFGAHDNDGDIHHKIDDVKREIELTHGMTIIGLLMTALFVMIAAGGGIGGGGVLVPTYIFVLGFDPKVAIPLSTITILGSSITNVILNSRKRHPLADRPLIDWDMMLVMEPLTIAGTVIGSFINVICPPWLLCIMLVILLALTTIKTSKKGIKMYKKETEQSKIQNELNAINQSKPRTPSEKQVDIFPHAVLSSFEGKPARAKTPRESNQKDEAVDDVGVEVVREDPLKEPLLPVHEKQILQSLYDSERYHSPYKIAAMLILTFGVLSLSVIKGGHGVNMLDIECGTWQYWVISLSVLPFVIIISSLSRSYLVQKYKLKKLLNFEYSEGDVEWNERNTVVYPLICSIAGLCAGLFGIGGGIVKGPLMLEMGVSPKVASATSATMILLTSSSAAVSYFLFNSLNLNFAPVLFSIGFVCTLIGQKVLNHFVKKYNRSSIIILVIALTVGASAIAMSIQSSGSLIQFVKGEDVTPSGLCV